MRWMAARASWTGAGRSRLSRCAPLWILCCLAGCCAPSTPPVGARAPAVRDARTSTWTYVVEPGDTLFEVARACGVSLDELMRLNRIDDPDRIEVSQLLVLPMIPAQRQATPMARPDPSRLRRHRQELALARRELASADFTGAANRLESLRRQVKSAEQGSRGILIALEELTAHVHAAFGDQQQAAAAFERALRLDPGYEPPEHCPPKVLHAFESARQESPAR